MKSAPSVSSRPLPRREFMGGVMALGSAALTGPLLGKSEPKGFHAGPNPRPCRLIGEHKIPGVILVGGDIHASRVLRYPTQKVVGYDLVQFIASPIHGKTIASLNVYNPDLVRSAVEPRVFLLVEADSTVSPAAFHATLINKAGEHVFSYHLTTDELQPKA